MNTLKIIAFHPERLREMILGNERKTVASLTTLTLIIFLLILLFTYAIASEIPISSSSASVEVYFPLIMMVFFLILFLFGTIPMTVVYWLVFSLFVTSPQISFKETFYMVCYVMLFWTLSIIVSIFISLLPTVILPIDNEPALSQWFADFTAIGLIILSTVHIVWFFNRSHDCSYLKAFVALFVAEIVSVFIYFPLLLGFFFLVSVSSTLWSAVWSSLPIHW